MSTVRLIRHEAVPRCGSFEVRLSDGTPGQYFDEPGRRRPEQVGHKEALEQGRTFARAKRDRKSSRLWRAFTICTNLSRAASQAWWEGFGKPGDHLRSDYHGQTNSKARSHRSFWTLLALGT
jgi:hypothetical protein